MFKAMLKSTYLRFIRTNSYSLLHYPIYYADPLNLRPSDQLLIRIQTRYIWIDYADTIHVLYEIDMSNLNPRKVKEWQHGNKLLSCHSEASRLAIEASESAYNNVIAAVAQCTTANMIFYVYDIRMFARWQDCAVILKHCNRFCIDVYCVKQFYKLLRNWTVG